MYAEEYMDLVKRKGKRIDRIGEVVGDSMDSAYFSTVRPFQPKQDYSSNQVPISHHTGVQEVGGSVMVQAPTGYGVYGSEESVGGKYKEESLKILQDQSGAILGRKKDFKKIIDFDKGKYLESSIYR